MLCNVPKNATKDAVVCERFEQPYFGELPTSLVLQELTQTVVSKIAEFLLADTRYSLSPQDHQLHMIVPHNGAGYPGAMCLLGNSNGVLR